MSEEQTTRFRICSRTDADYLGKVVQLYHTQALNEKARLATVLLERWGPVVATDDGEDSAGRHKLRALTAGEVVTKACDIAEDAYEEYKKRGWLIDLPDLEEINAKQPEKEKETVGEEV